MSPTCKLLTKFSRYFYDASKPCDRVYLRESSNTWNHQSHFSGDVAFYLMVINGNDNVSIGSIICLFLIFGVIIHQITFVVAVVWFYFTSSLTHTPLLLTVFNALFLYEHMKSHQPSVDYYNVIWLGMKTSWHGNVFSIGGPLWGQSTGHQWIPLTNDEGLVTHGFNVFFDVSLNRPLNKQSSWRHDPHVSSL